MRSENEPAGRESRTFIEEARRRQIIDAAVEVIVEAGYVRASLARIAGHAGISKGVISYHFDGRDELMRQLVMQLYQRGAEYMAPRIEAATTPREKLTTYLTANLEFIDGHRNHVRAMVEVVTNLRREDGTPEFLAGDGEEQIQAPLIEMLSDGQQAGEFGDFDARAVARMIRDVIDSAAGRAVSVANLDMAAYIDQVTTIFERATAHTG